MTTNSLSDALPESNGRKFSSSKCRAIIAAIDGVHSIEETVGDTAIISFRSLEVLPPRTPEEEKALAWEPALIEPAANFTYETRIDDAIKGARDLYEGSEESWPVAIWRWAAGGYGYGFSIPEDTAAILLIDGALQAFEDGRAAR